MDFLVIGSLAPKSSYKPNSFRYHEQPETEQIDPKQSHFGIFPGRLDPVRNYAIASFNDH